MTDDPDNSNTQTRRNYIWPRWVLGAVLLAIVLAVLWMSQEIARTRRIRDASAPDPQTNRGQTGVPPH